MDMREFANKLGADAMRAQAMPIATAPLHGYDYAGMPQPEKTGYAKALLDTIAYLDSQAIAAPNAIVAAGLRVAAQELRVYRNKKLSAAA